MYSFLCQNYTLKGTKITLPVIILYYSTLSGTNRQILTSKRYDEHPVIFIGESPLGFVVEKQDHHVHLDCICLYKVPCLFIMMKIWNVVKRMAKRDLSVIF